MYFNVGGLRSNKADFGVQMQSQAMERETGLQRVRGVEKQRQSSATLN